MKVAVVTPYYREADDVLRACLDSVRGQTHTPCRHFLVSDGFPNPLVDSYDATHIRLPNAHGDNGNLGRCVGAFTAISEGYDAIAFLDADNWFRSDHIARMVALHAHTGAAVCSSGRSIHRMDGSLLIAVDQESNGIGFADTSCLCIFRPAFDLMSLWGMMPREAGPICDRLMWDAVRMRGISRAHDPEPTMGFRSQYFVHYAHAGAPPPPGAKTGEVDEAALKFKSWPYVARMGLLLGLGGADELETLLAAHPLPVTQEQMVSAEGLGESLRLELPDEENIRRKRREIFADQIYRPVLGLAPPRAILDIGADVGLAAAYLRLAYPAAPVVCVEPDPRAFRLLVRNAQTIGNCHAIQAGVHFGNHARSFRPRERSAAGISGIGENATPRLLMIDAENLMQNLGRRDFDLIKIDAEGMETPILLSLRARLAETRVLLVEFYSDTDRQVMDRLVSDSHCLWHAHIISPHRGTLCYVLRASARDLPSYRS